MAFYISLPLYSIYNGIQLLFPDKIPEVTCLPGIEDARTLKFTKLIERFGEALPQFTLAIVFYVNHTYFIDHNDGISEKIGLPITVIKIFISGVSVLLGTFRGLKTLKQTYDEGNFHKL